MGYPCIECLVFHTDLDTCGPDRLVSNLAEFFEAFMSETGGNEKLGKFYFCQIHRPWLFATLAEHYACKEKMSDILVPSALHDWIGVGNHVVHEMGQLWPKLIE